MRNLILILFSLFWISSISAQQNFIGSKKLNNKYQFDQPSTDYNSQQLSTLNSKKMRKMKGSGEQMRSTGLGLTVGGLALIGISIPIMTKNANEFDLVNNEGGDGIGAALAIGGIGFLVPGIILSAKGGKSVRKAKREVTLTTTGNTARVRYRF